MWQPYRDLAQETFPTAPYVVVNITNNAKKQVRIIEFNSTTRTCYIIEGI